MSIFPQGFLWGAATSSHQVEGGNRNDWSEWEYANSARLAAEAARRHANAHMRIPDYILERYPNPLQEENYISGKACDHYHRFREDFDLAKSFGHNAHRFSIEWSRIEPEEGKFDQKEIEHYREVIAALRERGLEPFVTLWHWTNPIWVRDFGAEENKKFIFYFTRYVKCIVENFGDLVHFWITVNEPTSVVVQGYWRGTQPPGKKSFISAMHVFNNLVAAHKKSYQTIHAINPSAQVGFANFIIPMDPYRRNFLDSLSSFVANFLVNRHFLHKTGKYNDFLTVQYYSGVKIQFLASIVREEGEKSDLGWLIHPEGIYHILKDLSKYKKPIYITENGLADAKDAQRGKFIEDHLYWVAKAIKEGVDVRGYFHWSLLDNFEFPELRGFWPRFGLVEIDYKTMERKIRPSAWAYKKIIESSLPQLVPIRKIRDNSVPAPFDHILESI